MLQSQCWIPWVWNSISNWLHFQQRQPTSHWSWQAHHWRTAQMPLPPLGHCKLLYLAHNTCANILFAVCKFAKACIGPGKTNFHTLIWLIGYLRQRPYHAIKFYRDTTSNPVFNVCHQHRIPHSNMTELPAGKIAQTLAILLSDIWFSQWCSHQSQF